MDQRLNFASPVQFDRIADKDGTISFQEMSTTCAEEAVRIGAIFIKATSFNSFDGKIESSKKVKLTVGEIPLPKGSRSFQEFMEFVQMRRMQPEDRIEINSKNQLTASGTFPDQLCVPGYDSGCDTRQHGFLENREGGVKAAHFAVFAEMTGFSPGQRVSGYMMLEVLPAAPNKSAN